MQKLFKKHPEAILTVLAIIFLGIIGTYVAWGVGDVGGYVNNALNAKIDVNSYVGFNLSGAQALNLRGLVKPQQ